MKASSRLTNWLKKNTEGTMLMQWISYFMIFSILMIYIMSATANGPLNWRFYTTVLLLAVLLLTNILWFQSEERWIFRVNKRTGLWIINILTSLLVIAAFAISGKGEVVFLFFMLVAQFSTSLGLWPEGVLFSIFSLVVATVVLKAWGNPNDVLINFGAQYLAGMIFVLVFTLLEERAEKEKHRAEGLLKELQAANIELKAAQQKEKDLAIAEERMRMARDIHDGLGHHLTVLSIQLQAADKLVERNPQAAAQAIRTSRSEAKAALDEVRRSVGMMRQGPEESQPLDLMLKGLVEGFDEHTDFQVSFECSGTPYDLSSFARQTLFRAVQESLTNIQKHGKGVKNIWVKLDYAPEHVTLSVNDDGEKPAEGVHGQTGFGLQGLKERVDQLGGQFCCGPGALRGFQVDVTIPLKEAAGDPGAAGG